MSIFIPLLNVYYKQFWKCSCWPGTADVHTLSPHHNSMRECLLLSVWPDQTQIIKLFPDPQFSLPQTFSGLDLLKDRKDSLESCVVLIAAWLPSLTPASQGFGFWSSRASVVLSVFCVNMCTYCTMFQMQDCLQYNTFVSPLGESFLRETYLHLNGY